METFLRGQKRFRRCTNVSYKTGHDPLTILKSIQNHLADLTMLSSLERTEKNERRAGGVHYRYELAVYPEIIVETHESIKNQS